MATTAPENAKPGKGHDVSGEARDEDGRFTESAATKSAAAKPVATKAPARRKPAVSKSDPKPAVARSKGTRTASAPPANKRAAKPKTPKPQTAARKPKPRLTSHATALWGAAAAGVAVGVAAMFGRKLAVQAPTALAGDWDAALAAEHKAVIKLFDAIEQTSSHDVGKRTILLAQMKHALGKHALQEENVIYPALRDAGEVEAADHLNHDHGYVKQYLYELENCPKDSDRFVSILARFRVDLEKHVHEEEDQLYPMLKAKLSPETSKKLTIAMNKEGFKLA